MRAVSTTDTWDGVWAAYDQQDVATPAPLAVMPPMAVMAPLTAVVPAAVMALAPGPTRRLRLTLWLAPLLALLPTETLSLPGPAPWQAGLAGPVISLAPDEASLPPLAVAITRIAAESSVGACFAMRLHPQGDDCRILPAR